MLRKGSTDTCALLPILISGHACGFDYQAFFVKGGTHSVAVRVDGMRGGIGCDCGISAFKVHVAKTVHL